MAKSEETIDSYISARSAPVRKILEALRKLVFATVPGVTEGLKWGAPVFFGTDGEPFAYLYGGKDHANLGFLHGVDLDDPKNVLEGKGIAGRHVKIYPDDQMPTDVLMALLMQYSK